MDEAVQLAVAGTDNTVESGRVNRCTKALQNRRIIIVNRDLAASGCSGQSRRARIERVQSGPLRVDARSEGEKESSRRRNGMQRMGDK